jgi:hypothetical protein
MSGREVADRNAFVAVLSAPTDRIFDTIARKLPRLGNTLPKGNG